MKCVICGQMSVDGAFDQNGEYVCVDCWAQGEAAFEGRHVSAAVEADTSFSGNLKR